jgi:hypothetical protein
MNFVLAGSTIVAMALPPYCQYTLGGLFIVFGYVIEISKKKP